MDPSVQARMREDWNERAREDASYYVAFGRRSQDNEEFFATAQEVVTAIETELRRFRRDVNRRAWRALEIGCGPGRLMRPLSAHFGEIHGVDVSDEMTRLARANLAGIPHAHVHSGDGASLAAFADESFDLVYSYAVFQHIPSRDVVMQYLRETRRVLKTGGLFRGQLNGLPPSAGAYDTWSGVRFSADELMEFARSWDFQVLALEGAGTQYLWTSWRKRPPGWHARTEPAAEAQIRIRRITNAESSEPVAPSSGRFAAISIWAEHLPDECGLHDLEATVGGAPGSITYIGPPDREGIQQINVVLPQGRERTGLLPVDILTSGRTLLRKPATLRVIPPGPQVPRLISISDGVNLLSGRKIQSRTVKLVLEDVAHPDELRAVLDSEAALEVEVFCTNPLSRRFEFNVRLPDTAAVGHHDLEVYLGRRGFGPLALEVVHQAAP